MELPPFIALSPMPEKRRTPRKNDIWCSAYGERLYICRGGKKILFLNVRTQGLYVQDVETFMQENIKEDL